METMYSCRRHYFAVEILAEEMQNRETTSAGKFPEYISCRYSESSDSGMEDGATSPGASSVSSGSSEIRGLSVFNQESPVDGHPSLSKPTLIAPSESSAFSKIDRKVIPQIPFPTSVPVSNIWPNFGIGYLPGTCLTPWNWDSLHGGFPYPSSRGLSDSYATSSSQNEEHDDNDKPEIADKNAFYYVDTKIPFTNYFMNLTKIFHRDSTSAIQKNDNHEEKRDSNETRQESESNHASKLEENNFEEKSAENYLSKTGFESSVKGINTPENMTLPQRLYHPTGPLPLHSPIISTLPPPSLLQFMNTVNTPPSMFHPAFIQMNGVGMKRLPSDKPPPVKKYKCDVCGKAFSRSNTLVTHKRIHTGDKPFKCESCGRAFRQPGNLTRHRLTHTTVKPYVCPHCNKAFNRASNLNTHMRTHTSYKPFMCPYCGKGFNQKIDMKIHCYTHTGRIPTQQM